MCFIDLFLNNESVTNISQSISYYYRIKKKCNCYGKTEHYTNHKKDRMLKRKQKKKKKKEIEKERTKSN